MHRYQCLWNLDIGHRGQTLRHHLCLVLVVQNCIHLNQLLLQTLCQHIDHLHLKRHLHHHQVDCWSNLLHQQPNPRRYLDTSRCHHKHHRHQGHLYLPMDNHRHQSLLILQIGTDKHQHCCPMHYRQSHLRHNLRTESGRGGSHHLYLPSHRGHYLDNLGEGLLMFQRRLDSRRG